MEPAKITNPDIINSSVRSRYLNQQLPEDFLGPRGQLRYHGLNGHRMCGYYWPAENAKGVVILVHGQGSYLIFDYLKSRGVGSRKVYEGSWVEALNKAGYSCAGIDNRGCGRSNGLFGYVNDHTDWVQDVLYFTQSLQQTDLPGFAGLPTFLLGASLGGCISVHAALKKPEYYQGLMLLAPMISLDKVKKRGLNPVLIPLAALLNLVIPTWPLAKTPKNTMFPDLQADFDSDLCTYKYDTRIRVGVECLRACDSVLASMHKLERPLLVFHSIADTLTDPDGSKLLVDSVKSEDKTLRLLNDFWHVLTKEEGNEKLLRECLDWMQQRTPQV